MHASKEACSVNVRDVSQWSTRLRDSDKEKQSPIHSLPQAYLQYTSQQSIQSHIATFYINTSLSTHTHTVAGSTYIFCLFRQTHVFVNYMQTVSDRHTHILGSIFVTIPCRRVPLWSRAPSPRPPRPPERAQWRTRRPYHPPGYQFQTVALPAQTGHLTGERQVNYTTVAKQHVLNM